MYKSLYVVPISNFVIEAAFKVGDIIFSPPIETLEYMEQPYTNTLNENEYKRIKMFFNKLGKELPHIFSNSTVAFIEHEDIDLVSHQESSLFVNRISEIVDRAMDYFRLQYCQIGNFDTLPGIAGISMDGFKNILRYVESNNEFELLSGEVTIMLRDGIGLMPSREPENINKSEKLYVSIFNTRNDEVYNLCRTALRRINEAMYMNNLNTAFVYLMSTLEMLASPEFLGFKRVKSKILPFIANSKKEYNDLSTYLFDLSKNKRTEIVHNAKSLYDLYNSLDEIKRELFKITGLIIIFVQKVIELNITTLDELEKERQTLKVKLGF